MDTPYPQGHIIRIMALDGILVVVGLALLATPFAAGWHSGSLDTVTHVSIGALLATTAVFRVLLAFGSLWIEILHLAAGALVLALPTLMYQRWNTHYTTAHLVGGAIVLLCALASAVLTVPYARRPAASAPQGRSAPVPGG